MHNDVSCLTQHCRGQQGWIISFDCKLPPIQGCSADTSSRVTGLVDAGHFVYFTVQVLPATLCGKSIGWPWQSPLRSWLERNLCRNGLRY